MRKKTKTKIKEILKTLIKAQDHVELLLQKRQLSQAGDLLAQCQECAVEAGEAIERSEGMGTEAVSCLELYCEQLYHMSQTSDRKEVRSLKKQMENTLNQTRKLIDELPLDPMKVAFMPYKASMWDCMESVWEAAEADSGCEAYVVPIPFYEKNAHGSIEKECYEGDIFPKYVPITHYKEFSLEAEEPDVIYIHNPYDDTNYVTSVAPEYYSSNLKRYTDMLVYIPYYFNGSGPLPESHRDLTAYHYVDKIIMQDEEKAESLADSIPREKIAVLGSPKIDRLLKLEKKRQEIIENEIPEEWRKKIAGKKVILFNISVSGILQNSKYAMDKIRYVLSQFKGRDDVVLWWRPHPLIEGTLKSMRPEMYGEYMKIKRGFLKEGKGILDESGDAGVAAVVADAYLGENSSSLVHYFGVLGKPVMYTEWKILENKFPNRDCLYFSTFFKENNVLYFVPSNRGLAHELYSMNLENGEVKKEITFPGTPDNVEASYCGIKKIKNKIILVPHNSEDIYIYDLCKKGATKIVLSEAKGNLMLFDKVVEYKDKVFLLPKCYPAIVSINLETLKVHEIRQCIKEFIPKQKEIPIFTWAFCKNQKYVYIASYTESKVLIFNMEDETYKVKKIGNYSYGYTHMVYDGENFWLAACGTNSIVKWNEYTEKAIEYVYPINTGIPSDITYNRLLSIKDKIIICYGHIIDIGVIDKKSGEYNTFKAAKNVLSRMKKEAALDWGGIPCVEFLDEKTVLFFNWRSATVHLWNISSNRWYDYPCRQAKSEMLKNEKVIIEKYNIIRGIPYCIRESMVTIVQFIDYIKEEDTQIFKNKYKCYGRSDNNYIGDSLYNYIINVINGK